LKFFSPLSSSRIFFSPEMAASQQPTLDRWWGKAPLSNTKEAKTLKEFADGSKLALAHVAIIGTAGRGADAARMSAQLYERMLAFVMHIIPHTFELDDPACIILVSGGSAWADAVAVTLFLESHRQGKPFSGLELFLPCAWSSETQRYVETGTRNWRTDPGQTLNWLYRGFSTAMGRDMHTEMARAVELGAVHHTPPYASHITAVPLFHQRNLALAVRATHTIALTWGDSTTKPADGGTAFTFDHSTGIKVHQPLAQLL
jgi:hypothetical protein